MAPLRGWAPRGSRLIAQVPHRQWKTTTFLAALRHDRIDAPWLLEGPIDGESFTIYVEKVLLPTLRPGDIVIMDNLGSHRGKIVRQLIRSAGAKLFFLPKYSPDLNPIEQVFAKLKHLLRKAAARTVETVCAAIGKLLGTFTNEECANYFKNSGYDPTYLHHALVSQFPSSHPRLTPYDNPHEIAQTPRSVGVRDFSRQRSITKLNCGSIVPDDSDRGPPLLGAALLRPVSSCWPVHASIKSEDIPPLREPVDQPQRAKASRLMR